MSEIRASEKHISLWSGSGAAFGRYDYRPEEHRLFDMLNDDYFGDLAYMFRNGDMITIIDCEDQILTVRVDHVERTSRKVYLSRIERLYAMPVVALRSDVPDDPGLAWRWRARQGGGHSIVTAKGELVAINFPSKEVAEQAIAIMYKNKVFSPPVGHEPTAQYVRDAPIYRGQ
jgi:hypothetical protein